MWYQLHCALGLRSSRWWTASSSKWNRSRGSLRQIGPRKPSTIGQTEGETEKAGFFCQFYNIGRKLSLKKLSTKQTVVQRYLQFDDFFEKRQFCEIFLNTVSKNKSRSREFSYLKWKWVAKCRRTEAKGKGTPRLQRIWPWEGKKRCAWSWEREDRNGKTQ